MKRRGYLFALLAVAAFAVLAAGVSAEASPPGSGCTQPCFPGPAPTVSAVKASLSENGTFTTGTLCVVPNTSIWFLAVDPSDNDLCGDDPSSCADEVSAVTWNTSDTTNNLLEIVGAADQLNVEVKFKQAGTYYYKCTSMPDVTAWIGLWLADAGAYAKDTDVNGTLVVKTGPSDSVRVIVDSTPPTQPVVTDDGHYTTNQASLHVTWTPSSDAESGLAATG